MRPPGLEPGSPTWKVRIIPLDHGRLLKLILIANLCIKGENFS